MTDSVSEALLLEAQPHQAVQAAVQRPAQGRQELPVHQGHARRRLPARSSGPASCPTTEPLLRAVRVGVERRRGHEPRPAPVPVPDLHDRHHGGRAGAPAAVPPVPHQALPGPVHRGHLEGRVPRGHRAGGAVPRGPPGGAGQGAPPRDGVGAERQQYEHAAVVRDKIRAIERTMESQKMAAFARTELDLVALARKDDQAAVQLFVCATGRCSAGTCTSSTPRATCPTRRCSAPSSCSTTRARPASRPRSSSRGR